MRLLVRLLLLTLVLGVSTPAFAQTSAASEAQVAWRLLDYVSVDYAGAVADGKVVNPAEYGEMTEFAGQIRTRIDALPAKADLSRSAAALAVRIRDKASPEIVGAEAKTLAGALLAAYPSPLAPSFPPDLAKGQALYEAQCSVCHGPAGQADGPGAQGLDPAPIAFADVERALAAQACLAPTAQLHLLLSDMQLDGMADLCAALMHCIETALAHNSLQAAADQAAPAVQEMMRLLHQYAAGFVRAPDPNLLAALRASAV